MLGEDHHVARSGCPKSSATWPVRQRRTMPGCARTLLVSCPATAATSLAAEQLHLHSNTVQIPGRGGPSARRGRAIATPIGLDVGVGPCLLCRRYGQCGYLLQAPRIATGKGLVRRATTYPRVFVPAGRWQCCLAPLTSAVAHGTDADEVKSKATEGDSRCQARTFSTRLKLLLHMICY
jgi:hypothetical protein